MVKKVNKKHFLKKIKKVKKCIDTHKFICYIMYALLKNSA